MKQKVCVLLAVAFLMTLNACGVQPQAENQSGDQNPETTPVVTDVPASPVVTAEPVPLPVEPEHSQKPTEPIPAQEPTAFEPKLERPSDEEVLEVYLEAQEAFDWFHGEPLKTEGEPLEVDGRLCLKVEDERFPDLNSLRIHLKTLFSDEIVDVLLSIEEPRYFDLNGSLYTVVQEIPKLPESETELTVSWWSEELPVCTVHAAVEGDQEQGMEKVYAYPYQKVGDKWVFTQFEPIM